MSSDPTRPLPPPEWNPAAPTQQYPVGGQQPQPRRQPPAGRPQPSFTPTEQYPSQQPYQPQQQPQPQPQPQYQYDQQYMAPPPGAQGRRRRRRRRWPMVTGIIVIVLLALAVGADRLACFAAENDMANQVQQNGFPVKPSVTIEGFPFLTQLAAKDFNEVVISASNVTEGPLTISSIKATLHGMHLIDGYNGARIDTIDGTALVTFTALANAGGIPSGITLGPGASPSQIQATINVPILGNQTVTAQVTKTSPTQFNVRVLNADNIASSLLGNLANFTVNVPKLPAGVDIQSVTITQQGVLITITGHNTTLTEP